MNEPNDRAPGPAAEPFVLFTAGGEVDSCSVCLRFFGDDLDPNELTHVLGTEPTQSCRKGDVTRRRDSDRIEPSGKWLVQIDHDEEGTLAEKIDRLLNRMTSDLSVWHGLVRRFRADLYCGLHLACWNRGVSLPPRTLQKVAERRLELGLDVYYVGEVETTP
jgi:hypothetical protein